MVADPRLTATFFPNKSVLSRHFLITECPPSVKKNWYSRSRVVSNDRITVSRFIGDPFTILREVAVFFKPSGNCSGTWLTFIPIPITTEKESPRSCVISHNRPHTFLLAMSMSLGHFKLARWWLNSLMVEMAETPASRVMNESWSGLRLGFNRIDK